MNIYGIVWLICGVLATILFYKYIGSPKGFFDIIATGIGAVILGPASLALVVGGAIYLKGVRKGAGL